MIALGQKQMGRALSGNVCFWPKADIPSDAADVRFWPKTDVAK